MNGPTKNLCDAREGIEDGRTKFNRRVSGGERLQKSEHVFGRLLEVGFTGQGREGDFFREEINFENVPFMHRVREIAAVAAIVFEGWANVPSNFTVLTKSGARIGGNVGNNFGAEWGKRSAIVVEVAEERGMG